MREKQYSESNFIILGLEPTEENLALDTSIMVW